nr:hypothetical protein BaRGS_008748 [Batillaria attramentaria]
MKSPSPKGSTVAATTSRAAPVSGQGPATRSRSDRLRERVKVDTPDTSSNGADMDRHLEDVNGNASREGISGGDSRDGIAGNREEGGESEREDEEEDEDVSGGGADSDRDYYVDEMLGDPGDVVGEVVVGPLPARSSSGEEEEDDEDEDDSNGDDEEDSVNGDGESCHCTSNWSCGELAKH